MKIEQMELDENGINFLNYICFLTWKGLSCFNENN